MLSAKTKDIKLRQQFFLLEKKTKINKFLSYNLLASPNKTISNKAFITFQLLKAKTLKKVSKIKFNNRCISSNRSRGVVRSHSLSRIVMRDLLQFGIIPGFRKSVW